MILQMLNGVRGYVVIEVSGFSVERFVNLATRKGVYIWDLESSGSSVRMKVSARGFKELHICARKTKCKIKIESKHGYPFVAFKYRKRKVLTYGVVLFLGLIYVMSSFVWLIEINGNERVGNEEIMNALSGNGLKVGVFKAKADIDSLEEALLVQFKDLSWVDIYMKGTKVTVSVAEVLPRQELIDRQSPANIIAKKDGLIMSIATSAGTPKVKEHDVVKKGDLLVSSELIVKEDETGTIKEYVRARSEVWGKMYNEIEFTVPFEYTEKEYTGEIYKGYSINVINKNLNLIKPSKNYANYDKITSRKQLKFGENYPLPIIISTEDYREFKPIKKIYSEEQAKQIAEKIINNRVIREFEFEADIYDKQIEFVSDGKSLLVKALITSFERIDELQEFTPEVQEVPVPEPPVNE